VAKFFFVLRTDALEISDTEEVYCIVAAHEIAISLGQIGEMTVHALSLEQLLVTVVDERTLLVFLDGLFQLLAGDNFEGTGGLLVHHPHEEVSILVVIHGLVDFEVQEDLP